MSDREREWVIVPLRSGHLPALRQLFLESRRAAFHWIDRDTFLLHDLDEEIEGETILVAEYFSEPIGFVSWWPPRDFIHHLFVSPQWLRRGVGSALLAACLERIGRPATLKCLCRNEPALAFYRNLGWEVECQEGGVHGPYFLMAMRQ